MPFLFSFISYLSVASLTVSATFIRAKAKASIPKYVNTLSVRVVGSLHPVANMSTRTEIVYCERNKKHKHVHVPSFDILSVLQRQ